MENNEIQTVLMNALSLQEVLVSGDGSHFQVIAVGEMFEGMSRVKKQQTIYGPLMDDRVRRIAGGVPAAEYGRKQAFLVHQALKEKGPVTVPREFVFMDRAAIGLGGGFIHLGAERNFHRLFNEALEGFSGAAVAQRQGAGLVSAGL